LDISEIQIFAGLGLFILGVLIGVVIQKSNGTDGKRVTRLQQKLAESEEKHIKYQAQVSEHFLETARKVQTLNNSYQAVHEQLAHGATKLCASDEASAFIPLSFDQSHRGHTIESSEEQGFIPPMDYAPKNVKESEGTLSEKFGLEEIINAPDQTAGDSEELTPRQA
jgi:hypothetical protein